MAIFARYRISFNLMNLKPFCAAALISAVFLTACSNPPAKSEGETADTPQAQTAPTEEETMTQFEYDKMMANFPKPLAMENLIFDAGLKFDKVVLVPTEKATSFTSAAQKSVAFGMYAVDLGYLSIYEKKGGILKYLKATHDLANDLNAGEAFKKFGGDQADRVVMEKDSLLKLADDVYYESYNHIKGNNKYEVATLIVAGSFVESHYHALSALKSQKRNAKNEELFTKLFESKLHIMNLMNVLKQLEKKAGCTEMMNRLAPMQEALSGLKSPQDLTADKVEALLKVVATIRNQCIG